MLESFWENLKSGSDIRGIATNGESSKTIDLTNATIEKIMFAFATWVARKTELDFSSLTIAIGHDSRTSSPRIKNVCINTLRDLGINIYDCSLASTPAMHGATSSLKCSAALEITASHHPAKYNGLKFFTADGSLKGDDIREILQMAQDMEAPLPSKKGFVRSINIMERYCEKLKNLIINNIKTPDDSLPLAGMKIVVDAGNGVGGFFAKNVLEPLGADTQGSAFLEPDGNFPNHIPNPEDPQALASIIKLTKESEADLGIIFDTDVDRVAIVDKNGELIAQERLIALTALIATRNNHDSIIVTDSVTSDHLRNFLGKHNCTQFRYKRGYSNVISMAKKINAKGGNCPLAIETSGHAAFKENNFSDDGAYLAAKIVAEAAKLTKTGNTLGYLTKDLAAAKELLNARISINDANISEYASKVLNQFKNYANSNRNTELDKENIEGTRIDFTDKHIKGWLIIRQSIHDPELVLHAESDAVGGIKAITKIIRSCLNKFDKLDLSNL